MNLMPGILTVTLCRECDTPIAVKQTRCREGCEYCGVGYSRRPIAHHRYEVKLIEVIHEGPKKDADTKFLKGEKNATVSEKWPPLDPGTKVKTYKPNTDKRQEWTDEGWHGRRWGVLGVIIGHHDSHGLYYDVQHEDGLVAGYDPSEFDVVLESAGKGITE